MPPLKRPTILLTLLALSLILFYRLHIPSPEPFPHPVPSDDGKFHWSSRPQQYPLKSFTPLPSGKGAKLPKIQHEFGEETEEEREARGVRLKAVKGVFKHTWEGYKTYAWLQDELKPLSGGNQSTYGGWAVTLVDTLDTLWLMGLHSEFEDAVHAVSSIDFTTSDMETLIVFETTVRHLGGFLGAYDVSGGIYPVLLEKAVEVGDMLYAAFDTPNRLPVTRWHWLSAALGNPQTAQRKTLLAEIGSLSLEFTRLSQLTKDPKYFDAVQRIMDIFAAQQMETRLPGLWPIMVDAEKGDFRKGELFMVGAMADSIYEYLPKEYLLLSGRSPQYREMYERFIPAAIDNLFFRPLTPANHTILLSGALTISSPTDKVFTPHCQHISCFAGGMVALASKIFDRPDDMKVARQLVDGCVWAYKSMPSGIMPDTFQALVSKEGEEWDEQRWFAAVKAKMLEEEEVEWVAAENAGLSIEERVQKRIEQHRLVPGISDISERRYFLRPGAIESLFILYRLTGAPSLRTTAWDLFQSITNHTRTPYAHAALVDVTVPEPPQDDSMESFWTAETLKYFFLIFSEPSVVGLDEWVLSTEAHVFRLGG
ncbi:MAG: hypothetical protein M1839_002177 [Geoglossum umbratile]|nr:MAG: hypothetical protein M1839_002177 [Geoglossum umbratile]